MLNPSRIPWPTTRPDRLPVAVGLGSEDADAAGRAGFPVIAGPGVPRCRQSDAGETGCWYPRAGGAACLRAACPDAGAACPGGISGSRRQAVAIAGRLSRLRP